MSARGESVAVVGSLNVDLVVTVERFPAPGETVEGRSLAVFAGGKGANQACAVGRLGGRAVMVGRVGADAYGELLRNGLESAGVDVAHVAVDPDEPTGTAAITLDATGQNHIVVVAGANGACSTQDLDAAAAALASAAVVLLQLEIPLATVAEAARRARAAGALVILDPAPARALPDALLGDVDVLTPNETELTAMTGGSGGQPVDERDAIERARTLLGRGSRAVVVKLGALGAVLVEPEREHVWRPPQVVAVDTTAAGDAFNGAFALALARRLSVVEAGAFATAAAACSVTRAGAQPSMPTAEEVGAVMRLDP